MSFQDSEPTKFEKGRLHLSFKSETFKEKVGNIKNQAVILKAFDTVLKSKISLSLEMKQVNLKPVTEEVSQQASQDPSVVDMAKEVFGVNKD